KLIGGDSPLPTTPPLAARDSEPTGKPPGSHSLISEATDTVVRSRSSFDRKPFVTPLSAATPAIAFRAACLAARNCAPIRGLSSGRSGIALVHPPSRALTAPMGYQTDWGNNR